MESFWQYSTVHNSACKVMEEQTLWGQTVCRVWLPNQDSVVRVSRSALRPQVGIQRPQGGAGNADHRILVRQPDTAHRLPPQGLFFHDLEGAVMNGAVLPKRLHPLITLYLYLLPAESESQVQCEF